MNKTKPVKGNGSGDIPPATVTKRIMKIILVVIAIVLCGLEPVSGSSFAMALVIGDTTLSGKIGNRVYMKNGRVRQLHVTATDTPFQQAIRIIFSNLSMAWAGLTATQRTSWREAAASGLFNHPNRVGLMVQPSGFQLYKGLNGNLLMSKVGGVTSADVAPAKDNIIGFNAFTMEYVDGVSVSIVTADTDRVATAGDVQVLEGTVALSPGIDRISRSQYRTIGSFGVGALGSVTTAYETAFGADTEHAGMHFRMCIQNASGQRSPWIYATATL